MQKEEVLKTLKKLLLDLRDNSKAFMENEEFRQEWHKRQEALKAEIDKLNSCDMLWLNDTYAKWMKEDFIKKVDPSILAQVKFD